MQKVRTREPSNEESLRAQLFAGARAVVRAPATPGSVVADLKRVHGQLSEQVGAADRTLAVLDASGHILRSAADEYRSLGTAVKIAGSQTRAFKRREHTLRLLVALTVLLFAFVCFYIVRRRLYYQIF